MRNSNRNVICSIGDIIKVGAKRFIAREQADELLCDNCHFRDDCYAKGNYTCIYSHNPTRHVIFKEIELIDKKEIDI